MMELHSGRVFPAVVGVFSIAVRIRQKIGKIVEIRHCLVCPCPVYPQNWSIIRQGTALSLRYPDGYGGKHQQRHQPLAMDIGRLICQIVYGSV
jgi:hypothetical protein